MSPGLRIKERISRFGKIFAVSVVVHIEGILAERQHMVPDTERS